ncbi:MAG: hypothetical protein AAF291_11275 [Pseudomonadota bacterium]
MHRPASNTASLSSPAFKDPARASSRRKIGLWVIVGVAALLTVAWVDGGEEPLHAIKQPVSLADGSAS